MILFSDTKPLNYEKKTLLALRKNTDKGIHQCHNFHLAQCSKLGKNPGCHYGKWSFYLLNMNGDANSKKGCLGRKTKFFQESKDFAGNRETGNVWEDMKLKFQEIWEFLRISNQNLKWYSTIFRRLFFTHGSADHCSSSSCYSCHSFFKGVDKLSTENQVKHWLLYLMVP